MGWILTQVLEWPLNGAHVRLISVAAQGFEYGRDKTPFKDAMDALKTHGRQLLVATLLGFI